MSACQVVFTITLMWQIYISHYLSFQRIKIITKKSLYGLIIFMISGVISPAKALSNDPLGTIFIAKSFGDISNCGPIVGLMAIKYVNQTFTVDNLPSLINRARKIVEVERTSDDSDNDDIVSIKAYDDSISQHWWKMYDIKTYLSHNNVRYQSFLIDNQNYNEIVKALNDKAVVIINVNMNDLPLGDEVGKPYFTLPIPGGWGHFLMIVGYKVVDNQLLFEIHDSYTKKGKNHYYYADNIMRAIHVYYHEVLAVNKSVSLGLLWASAKW